MGAGVRFFEMSYADIKRDSVAITVTSSEAAKLFPFSRDPFSVYQSTGSDDLTTETIEINFATSRTIDSLILVSNNFKAFNFDYWDGSAWQNAFTPVTGNEETTYFKQFSEQTTTKVRLQVDTTMSADAEKSIGQLIITKSIGQLVGYPEIAYVDNDRPTVNRMIDSKESIVWAGTHKVVELNFRDYVGNADRTLFIALAERYSPFLVWPCGGDTDQFLHIDIGYRLEDIFLVNIDGRRYRHNFFKNAYFSGMNVKVALSESA